MQRLITVGSSLVATSLVAAACLTTAIAQDPKTDLSTRLDTNKDGKVMRAELPERQQPNFAQIDANSDGAISREELTAFARRGGERVQPTHADVAYGPHQRNKLDLYLVDSDTPTPLVLYIHGGGFRAGDKSSVNAADIRAYHREGWSVAAINYRLTNVLPAPGQYLDCARALQFLRHHAKDYRLDPQLVASTGGSAGAGTSLWLAFHDDLADPRSDDPIARQSTRLICTAVTNGQSSYDPRFAERAGLPRPNFERHEFFEPFYGLKVTAADTPKAYKRYEVAAPITYLTKDDPPALLHYTFQNQDVTNTSSLGLVVHHPKLGIALKEQMDTLGIECIVQYRAADGNQTVRHGGGEVVSSVDFIKKHFAAAKK